MFGVSARDSAGCAAKRPIVRWPTADIPCAYDAVMIVGVRRLLLLIVAGLAVLLIGLEECVDLPNDCRETRLSDK